MKREADQPLSTLRAIMKYLGIIMSFVYVTAGVFVMIRSQELFSLPKPYIIPLGLGLMGYGIFRAYRLYVKYFSKRI